MKTLKTALNVAATCVAVVAASWAAGALGQHWLVTFVYGAGFQLCCE
jgi:hypothetical protein